MAAVAEYIAVSPIIGIPQVVLDAVDLENITSKLQALATRYPTGVRIVLPPGNFTVNFGKWAPASNTVVQARKGATTITGAAATADSGLYGNCIASLLPGRSNVAFDGINFIGPDRWQSVVIARGFKGLTMTDCDTGNMCLIWTQRTARIGVPDEYAAMNASTWCSDFHVDRCVGTGGAAVSGSVGWSQWIEMRYVQDWSVRNCKAANYDSGIQFWGGNSGATADAGSDWISGERKCVNGLVENCIMTDVPYGCVWGSMGKNIRVVGGLMARATDICLDFEGCEECSADGCYVQDGGNACVATFYGAKGVSLKNLWVVISDATLYPHAYRVFCNHGQNSNARHRDVVLEGWHVDCKSYGTAGLPPRIGDASGPQEGIIIRNCRLINTRIQFDANNERDVTIIGNELDFRLAATAAFNAIYTNKNHRDATGEHKVTIERNKIRTRVAQPANSRAVYCKQEGYNALVRLDVTDNVIRGAWTRDFLFENDMRHGSSRFDILFARNKLAQPGGVAGVWELVQIATAEIMPTFIYQDNTFEIGGYSADWRFSQTVDLPSIAAGAYSDEQTLAIPAGVHATARHVWEGSAAAIANGNRLDIEAWITTEPTLSVAGVLTWRARNKSAAAVDVSGAVKFRQVSRVP